MAIRSIHVASRSDAPAATVQVWDHLKALETGDVLTVALFSRISVQIDGQFDGASVMVEGSNDGQHWYVLIDAQDNHMQFTYDNLADVGQLSRWLRPVVLGGGKMTDLTVTAFCRGV